MQFVMQHRIEWIADPASLSLLRNKRNWLCSPHLLWSEPYLWP